MLLGECSGGRRPVRLATGRWRDAVERDATDLLQTCSWKTAAPVDKYVVTTIDIGAQIIPMSSMKCLYTMQKLESSPYNNILTILKCM